MALLLVKVVLVLRSVVVWAFAIGYDSAMRFWSCVVELARVLMDKYAWISIRTAYSSETAGALFTLGVRTQSQWISMHTAQRYGSPGFAVHIA